MKKYKPPKDLYSDAVKKGTRWFATFRVPWKAKAEYVREDGEIATFDNEALALRAAAAVKDGHFRDDTRGWISADNEGSNKSEIEAVFGKGAK